MDRIVLLIAESIQLQRRITNMTSQFLRLLPPPSGGSMHIKVGDTVTRPPRDPQRTRRHHQARRQHRDVEERSNDVITSIDDEDKENVHNGVQMFQTPRESCKSCLSTVVESYLSPLRVNVPSRPSTGWFYITDHDDDHRVRKTPQSSFPTSRVDFSKDSTLTSGQESTCSSELDIGTGSKTSVWHSDSDTMMRSFGSNNVDNALHQRRPLHKTVHRSPTGSECLSSRDRDEPLPTLCDISLISRTSANSLPREQISSADYEPAVSDHVTTMNEVSGTVPSAGAFHSTFNYPLHSTLRCTMQILPAPFESTTTLSSADGSTDSGNSSATLPSASRCREPTACRGQRQHLSAGQGRGRCDDETRTLRRQTGTTQLEPDSFIGDSHLSIHATCGSVPDLNALHDTLPVSQLRVHSDVTQSRRRVTIDQRASVVQRRCNTDSKRCHANSRDAHSKRSREAGSRNRVSHVTDNRCYRNARPDNKTVRVTPSLLGNGCLPACSYRNDSTVTRVTSHRRRRNPPMHRRTVVHSIRKRSLASKLKLFSNILCSTAGVTDSTHIVTNLGNL